MSKILIIAPNLPDLTNVPDEVAGLANRVPSVLLQGTVTKESIIGAIEREGSFEGFWFASHGSDSGILLSGGVVLSAYDIAAHANTANCEWVVLNTCQSRTLVAAMQSMSMVDVVATESPNIADIEAWQFARLLAIEFSKSGNIRKSVQVVAPGSTVHRYYRNERIDMTRQNPPTNSPPLPFQITPSVEENLSILMGWVDGDRRRGVVGLREQSAEILARLEQMERRQTLADDERGELSAKLTTAYYILIAVALGVMAATGAIVWLFATTLH